MIKLSKGNVVRIVDSEEKAEKLESKGFIRDFQIAHEPKKTGAEKKNR